MSWPVLSEAFRRERLTPPGEGFLRMVLDTDTYNEIDDQFAVVHALGSRGRLEVEAICAAPFYNDRSTDPGDGMDKSYEEIGRLLDRLGVSADGLVFRGSRDYLASADVAQPSDAATRIVERALADDDRPLYVAAIGAITNVASAILQCPEIIERIVVVWLGGQPPHRRSAAEFNLRQDLHAARVVLDCGAPLVLLPCEGVTSHLLTTVPEIERHVAGCGAIGEYLAGIFKAYHDDHFAWSKVIWDIAATGWLVNPEWVPTELAPSPILTDDVEWRHAADRHEIRVGTFVRRDGIFRDLFAKLAAASRPA